MPNDPITVRDLETQPVELPLENGAKEIYQLNPVTKKVLADLHEREQELDRLDQDDPRSIVLLGEQLDVLLEKTGGTKQKPASAWLIAKWEEDKLSRGQIQALLVDLRAAEFPT